MSKPSEVIVVLEDDRHKMLLYRYLKKHGLGTHAIRIERSPAGEGSADAWVCERYVIETTAYRSRHAKTALIVVIDADVHTVNDRLRQLDQALREGGKGPLDIDREQVARLVPKRNVETWILCLNDHVVDEETDYKRTHHHWATLIPNAADSLFQWTRPNSEVPGNCIASLRSGMAELSRLSL